MESYKYLSENQLKEVVGGYFNPLDALYTPICSPKVAFNLPCSLGGGFSGGGGGGGGGAF